MQSWEAESGWEKIVAQPVVKYKMTPAGALEVLEAVGKLTMIGISPDAIIKRIKEMEMPIKSKVRAYVEIKKPLRTIKRLFWSKTIFESDYVLCEILGERKYEYDEIISGIFTGRTLMRKIYLIRLPDGGIIVQTENDLFFTGKDE